MGLRITRPIALAVGLGSIVAGIDVRSSSAAAATRAGSAAIVSPRGGGALRSGGSATDFQVKLPNGSACEGDSANMGYRVQSYLVPVTVDPAGLSFDSSGPVPAAGEFRTALFDTTTLPLVSQLTAAAIPPSGPGPIIQPLPAFNFAVFDPAMGFPFPPGTYNVGIACTLGPPSATQQEKFWNTVMSITADPADVGPAKIRWEVADARATTTATTTGLPIGWIAIGAGAALTVVGSLALRRRASGTKRAQTPPQTKETR